MFTINACIHVSGADPGKRKGGGAKSIKLEVRVVSSEQSTNNWGVTHFWCSKTGHSQPGEVPS